MQSACLNPSTSSLLVEALHVLQSNLAACVASWTRDACRRREIRKFQQPWRRWYNEEQCIPDGELVRAEVDRPFLHSIPPEYPLVTAALLTKHVISLVYNVWLLLRLFLRSSHLPFDLVGFSRPPSSVIRSFEGFDTVSDSSVIRFCDQRSIYDLLGNVFLTL